LSPPQDFPTKLYIFRILHTPIKRLLPQTVRFLSQATQFSWFSAAKHKDSSDPYRQFRTFPIKATYLFKIQFTIILYYFSQSKSCTPYLPPPFHAFVTISPPHPHPHPRRPVKLNRKQVIQLSIKYLLGATAPNTIRHNSLHKLSTRLDARAVQFPTVILPFVITSEQLCPTQPALPWNVRIIGTLSPVNDKVELTTHLHPATRFKMKLP
jgi:hypothetical protein